MWVLLYAIFCDTVVYECTRVLDYFFTVIVGVGTRGQFLYFRYGSCCACCDAIIGGRVRGWD